MKNKVKQFLSLVLVLSMFLTALPVTANAVSQTEFDSRLSALRAEFPDYSRWTASFDGGSQCFGFARLIGYRVFGTYPSSWPKVYSLDGVKAGDILQYGNTSGSGHTVFVTSVSGDTITFVDCNGNGNYSAGTKVRTCGIKWDNTITKGAQMFSKYSFSYLLSGPGIGPGPVPDDTYDAQCFLDTASGGANSVYVKGWAFDRDDPGAALEIHVYVGGVHRGTLTANTYRPDVNAAFPEYGLGDYHGFEGTIALDASIGGAQTVEVFGISVGGGNNTSGGSSTVTVINDTTAPVISDVTYTDLSSSGYTVTCTVTDDVAVDRVLFPTWTVEGDQDDLPSEWGRGTQNGNTFTYRVNISDHNNEHGTYVTHIYAYDASGNCTTGGLAVNVPLPDSEEPVISEVQVYDITPEGYTVVCKATDNLGIDRVVFPTWTTTNGQDDLQWGEGSKEGDYYTARIRAVDHNSEMVGYATHIYAYDADGNSAMRTLGVMDLPTVADTQKPVISNVQVTDVTAVGYTVICTVTDNQRVNRVQMPTWTDADGMDDIINPWGFNAKVRATAEGTTYTYRVKISDHNHETGDYSTHIYAWDDAGNYNAYTIDHVEVPQTLPLAEGLKDDFYASIRNNASLTVLTSTGDVVFSADKGLDTQRWHFVKNDDGTYMIYGAADESLVLDIELAKDSTDANVQMCTYNGSNAQRWYIHEYNGLYYLRPACSGQLLLDLPYASTADGSAAKINYPNFGGGEGMNLMGDIFRTYTVTYNANGGENAPEAQTKIWGQSLTLRNTAPSRSGYTFLGWAESPDGEAPAYMPGDVYTADAALTLYAVWKSNAPAVAATGWTGENQWTLTDDGVLTIYGSGNMKNYSYNGGQPWLNKGVDITTVVIEEGVKAVGSGAFRNLTTLKSVSFPETTLEKMGEAAFYGSGLESVEIPASLWTIQPYTFKNCANLTSVKFNEGNLQKISDGAFYGTGLTELVLPDCLSILDVYAFKGCADLTDITIGSGLTELREAVFYGTAIPTITVPEGITKIGPYAFKNCVALETIDLPESLTSVGEASFYACTSLKTVELPDAVTSIGNYAFRKCAAITELTFGDQLTTIGECAFYGCTGLTEIVIPDKVTTIKPYAFKTCTGLTSVTLGSSVKTIGEGAFNTCTGLKTIVFPESLTTIGDYCFANSEDLWKLTFRGDAPAIGTGAFKGLDAYAYYPAGNTTWTSANMLNYGGSITWKAQ